MWVGGLVRQCMCVRVKKCHEMAPPAAVSHQSECLAAPSQAAVLLSSLSTVEGGGSQVNTKHLANLLPLCGPN